VGEKEAEPEGLGTRDEEDATRDIGLRGLAEHKNRPGGGGRRELHTGGEEGMSEANTKRTK